MLGMLSALKDVRFALAKRAVGLQAWVARAQQVGVASVAHTLGEVLTVAVVLGGRVIERLARDQTFAR